MIPQSYPANPGPGSPFASITLDETSGVKTAAGIINLQVPQSSATASDMSGYTQRLGEHFSTQSRLMLLVVVIILGFVGFVHVLGQSDDPIENIVQFFTETFGTQVEPAVEVEMPESRGAEEIVLPPFNPTMAPNPYWILPNELGVHPSPMGAIWLPVDRERWRLGMNHKYNFQHYKAVKEVRQLRYQGSYIILFAGLDEKKFWTRMESAIGLAEFGYKLEIDVVAKAVGDARADLMVNYLQRLKKGTTPGETYVLKHMIRVVPAQVRREILEILAKDKTANSLYFAAAKYDPSPMIQSWLQSRFGVQVASEKDVEKFQKLVLDDYMGGGSLGVSSVPAVPANQPETVETVSEEELIEDVTVMTQEDEEASDQIGDGQVIEDDGFNDLLNNAREDQINKKQ